MLLLRKAQPQSQGLDVTCLSEMTTVVTRYLLGYLLVSDMKEKGYSNYLNIDDLSRQ